MVKSPYDIFSVKDKVIIITGGAGYLGMQYAEILGKAGAKVVVWDNKDKEAMKKCQSDLKKKGVSALVVEIDITDENSVQKAIKTVVNKFKTIDVLINNAAMNPAVGSEEAKKLFVPYEEYPIELWRKELDVNLTGMMICTKAVVSIMIKKGSGSIINIASEVSNIAHDHRVYNQKNKFKSPAYVTTKTGVIGFTRQWAARLGEYEIRVNAFSPGGVYKDGMPGDFVKLFGNTNMFGRMAKSFEYAGPILFLSSDASSFMTGANLTVDGGKSAW